MGQVVLRDERLQWVVAAAVVEKKLGLSAKELGYHLLTTFLSVVVTKLFFGNTQSFQLLMQDLQVHWQLFEPLETFGEKSKQPS